ncbi:MAG: 16S rRNA (uracil(1498)-N(3))-methyltransferase [Gammaproteobacteria bacterium]|nr:16S rRNA (uracil(1498)-N(3))-methyltransferase [Gammaproteobacteria bacterium]MCY4282568.1 16S rRNA (uracil(1498)-N(3))-methyltransferase [Gammaproteobacteria bacterium]
MRNHRIYTETPLAVATTVVLPAAASHHLLRVLRCRDHEPVTLFNGHGGSYRGRLVSASAHPAKVEILEFEPEPAPPALLITLGLGISRSVHMDYAVQKSVELGVHALAPLHTQRSNVKLDRQRRQTRMEHWQKTIIHACEQCGRNTLPALSAPSDLQDWVAADRDAARFIFVPTAGQALSQIAAINGREVRVLVGPEGGFTDKEQETAVTHGFVPITLGPRTLRTETATVAALAALQVLWGDLC